MRHGHTPCVRAECTGRVEKATCVWRVRFLKHDRTHETERRVDSRFRPVNARCVCGRWYICMFTDLCLYRIRVTVVILNGDTRKRPNKTHQVIVAVV